jgi:hypothetical protein
MFEKLTPRERKLAYVISGLLPIAILFIGVFSFIKKYNTNEMRETALTEQVNDEEYRMEKKIRANRRRAFYNNISLAADNESSSNDYQSWIKGLVRDELRMTLKTLTPRNAGAMKAPGSAEVIGTRKSYALTAIGNLDQLTQFLSRFYSADLLHRINSMKLTAINETASGDKKVRTGKLSIIAQIEVLSLMSATDNPDLLDKFRAENLQESQIAQVNNAFREYVVHRDIFGPPNNLPTIEVRTSSSYTSETDVRATVTAKDADEDDELTYELVESSIEGATLTASKPGSRSGRLFVPGQKAGTYKFKVKVVDNGFPAKETFKDVSIRFKDRVVSKPKTKVTPKPEPVFINAEQTKITGIVQEKTGDWRVWITVRTTQDRHKLKVGESFELDSKKWIVDSITPNEAVLRVDNKLLTFRPKDWFTNPRSEELVEGAEATVEPSSDTGAKTTSESDAAPKPRVSA